MEYKDQIISAVAAEVKILKCLFAKIPRERYSYRPQEGMRSIEETLQYLTWCSSAMLKYYTAENGEAGKAAYVETKENAGKYELPDFPKAMDAQLAVIEECINTLTQKDLETKEVMAVWGEKLTLGEIILGSVVKYMTAYRMQLFLFTKISGSPELDTYDCWVGKDAEAE